MPELPEVEAIVRQLRKSIQNKTISHVTVLDPQVADPHLSSLKNIKITNISRRAKYLIFALTQDKYLLVHLRMTGSFNYYSTLSSALKNKKDHLSAIFYLSDGSILEHQDVRRFGFIKLCDKNDLEREFIKLGPEPLEKEFTFDLLHQILQKKSKSNIKTLLLDQKVIAGIGNIYAQEALYYAGINPLRKSGTLSALETKRVHREIIRVLNLAIKHGGSTVSDYINLGGEGNFQNFLAVYQKERCPKKHLLKRIVQGSRSTSYCPKCQK